MEAELVDCIAYKPREERLSTSRTLDANSQSVDELFAAFSFWDLFQELEGYEPRELEERAQVLLEIGGAQGVQSSPSDLSKKKQRKEENCFGGKGKRER